MGDGASTYVSWEARASIPSIRCAKLSSNRASRIRELSRMPEPTRLPPGFRFASFEVDLRAGELRKQGRKVKLQHKAFQVLAALLECPREVVTREELRGKLWPGDTFVVLDDSLNHAVNKLREALGDVAEHPHFIETLPRYGYRFIAPVETVAPVSSPAAQRRSETAATEAAGTRRVPRRSWIVALPVMVAIGAAIILIFNVAGLRDRLLTGVGARRTVPTPRIESIAVLPLENLSGDPAQEYFADGMTEALITNLGQIKALRVISRTSVMRYKETKKPLPDIARELKVDGIVEGAVLRSGDRVRITVQLIDANTDRHLWARLYERDLRDVLTLQSEVTSAIAREIQITVTPQEVMPLRSARPVNPEAYDLYLKGQHHYYRWRKEEFEKAIEYFQKAIEADPKYAPAYVGLANSYGWLWILGFLPPKEALPKFDASLKKALELDETLPEARYALAVAAFYYLWNWGEAEAEFKRTLDLNPNLVEARYEYAWFLSTMGRFEEAIAEAKRAVRLDPLSVPANLALGSVYHYAHLDDQAIAQLLQTVELEPNDPRPHGFLAGIYDQMGRCEDAVRARQKAMSLSGVPPQQIAGLGRAYSLSGCKGYLMWRLERLNDPYFIAIIQMRLGHKDDAFVWLEKAYKEHRWAMVQLKALPAWDPLRSDPRFQDLLRRVGLPP